MTIFQKGDVVPLIISLLGNVNRKKERSSMNKKTWIVIGPTEVNPWYDVCLENSTYLEGIVNVVGSFPNKGDAEDYLDWLENCQK